MLGHRTGEEGLYVIVWWLQSIGYMHTMCKIYRHTCMLWEKPNSKQIHKCAYLLRERIHHATQHLKKLFKVHKTAWYGPDCSKSEPEKKKRKQGFRLYLDTPSFFYCGKFQNLTGPLFLEENMKWLDCDCSGSFWFSSSLHSWVSNSLNRSVQSRETST